MAMKRFPCEKYASLEMNRAAYLKTGMVVSQTPLGEEFTKDSPCENGMWVNADKSVGTIDSVKAVTDMIGIVYTAEKEYDDYHYGLKHFGRKIAGDYPRVGILGLGDTFTTNCLQYDDSEYSDFAALEEALKGIKDAPVYVVPVANSPVPKLTASKPAEGTYGTVVKYYTVPNGEKGVKYNIVRV
jgi:hypothetical protein